MGFSDREIVALSGAHTLGRCHRVRSGFDGPWTSKPLAFDNEYFVNLLYREWTRRQWEGPEQYEDESGKLMMLPTDLALIKDPEFKQYVELYAKDQNAFYADFALAFAKLLSLGCPAQCNPSRPPVTSDTQKNKFSAEFRELAMHGSVHPARQIAPHADVHQVESTSGRSALHKAAFWGHNEMVAYLVNELKLNVNQADFYGDTPLHDAAKFGHHVVAEVLLNAGSCPYHKNNNGKTPLDLAILHGKGNIVSLINTFSAKAKSASKL